MPAGFYLSFLHLIVLDLFVDSVLVGFCDWAVVRLTSCSSVDGLGGTVVVGFVTKKDDCLVLI